MWPEPGLDLQMSRHYAARFFRGVPVRDPSQNHVSNFGKRPPPRGSRPKCTRPADFFFSSCFWSFLTFSIFSSFFYKEIDASVLNNRCPIQNENFKTSDVLQKHVICS